MRSTRQDVEGKGRRFLEKLDLYDTHQLDCLLHPEKHPVILQTGPCDCGEDDPARVKVCPFHAIHPGESGEIRIEEESCAGCLLCLQECRAKKLTASKDVIPAFLGQFNTELSPGKLRNALKKIGFDGMIELSLFADILTLKEALEFDRNIVSVKDYQLLPPHVDSHDQEDLR